MIDIDADAAVGQRTVATSMGQRNCGIQCFLLIKLPSHFCCSKRVYFGPLAGQVYRSEDLVYETNIPPAAPAVDENSHSIVHAIYRGFVNNPDLSLTVLMDTCWNEDKDFYFLKFSLMSSFLLSKVPLRVLQFFVAGSTNTYETET